MPSRKTTVCWISSARYSRPLEASAARKWQLVAQLRQYELRVIGFATSLRPRRFQENACFYLLPQPAFAALRYLTFLVLTPPLLLAVVGRHDVSILVAQSPFEGAIGAFVKTLARLGGRRLRLIIENHNNFEEDLFLQRRIPMQGLFRWLMMAAARFAFRHADALRVISTSTAERARHYAPSVPQARFMTFSDSAVFRATERRAPLAAAQDIVYAGVLIPRKGLHHLLNAFAQLEQPQARLYLVGGAENSDYARALQEQASRLGICDRVRFVGAVSQRQLAERLAAARVMVLPSLSEGLGRVVVEAMLVGTPVIGACVGGIPDMIRHGENGLLVKPGDESALAAALDQIFATDPTEMGANARRFAQDFFTPEKYVAGYRQLFELSMR